MISTFRERTDKPHIFFRDGYWRVNLSNGGSVVRLKPWNKAHSFINPWNRLQSAHLRLNYPFRLASAGIGLEPGCECTEVDYCENCLREMSRDNGRSDARVGSAEGVSQQTTWVHRAADSDGCD